MQRLYLFGSVHLFIVIAVILGFGSAAYSQPNPYRVVEDWAQLPDGRAWGAVSWVYPDQNGGVWVAERCGQNRCVGRNSVAPVLLFDDSGQVVRSFGEGRFVWPHGIYVDPDGNVWVADGRGEGGKGFQVFKFSPSGEVLMTLGTAGIAGSGPGQFSGPTHVVVSDDGTIFVTDGHEPDGNNRVVKFSSNGQFIKAWGEAGSGPGQFLVPHSITMDSTGRLFVADRDNNRIQIFDQEGNFIDEWKQFGRPSGVFVDANDNIYVSDNQSDAERNPGWMRGIRVGSALDGSISVFIPDPDFDPRNPTETSAHGIAADADGNIYGAEVPAETLKKYVRR